MKKYFLDFISILIIIYAIILNIFFPSQNKIEAASLFPELKSAFITSVKKNSSLETADLGLGYLVGEKSEIPEGIEKKIKTVGLSHIIVVSGTHLSIIVALSKRFFKRVSRFISLYFSLALLIFYVSLVGLSPSLLRASFVAVFGLFAWFFGRPLKPERTLLLTLGFCLAANPYLLTNLSFELSILAYFGISILFPALKSFFYGPKKPSFLGRTILSSISASLACLPLQLYFFGSFNFLSILANLLILPTLPLAMFLSFLTGLFGLLNLPLAPILGQVSNFILGYHIKIIDFLSDKSEFLIETKTKNPLFLLFYLFLVLAIILITKNRLKKRHEKFKKLKALKALDLWN